MNAHIVVHRKPVLKISDKEELSLKELLQVLISQGMIKWFVTIAVAMCAIIGYIIRTEAYQEHTSTNISELRQNQTNVLSTQTTNYKVQIDTLKAITDLSGNVHDLRGDIKTLNTRIDSLTKTVDRDQQRVDTIYWRK